MRIGYTDSLFEVSLIGNLFCLFYLTFVPGLYEFSKVCCMPVYSFARFSSPPHPVPSSLFPPQDREITQVRGSAAMESSYRIPCCVSLLSGVVNRTIRLSARHVAFPERGPQCTLAEWPRREIGYGPLPPPFQIAVYSHREPTNYYMSSAVAIEDAY